MRAIFLIIALFSVTLVKAQMYMPGGFAGYPAISGFSNNLLSNDSLSNKKWSVSRFGGLSTSFAFFKGGNATIVSAPVGFQLNRRLNDNFYAFANIAVAPAYVNFNHSFISAQSGKLNPGGIFAGSNSLGVYSAASMGLMYINADKTFSISGSISVERSSMPLLPMYPSNVSRATPFNPSNR